MILVGVMAFRKMQRNHGMNGKHGNEEARGGCAENRLSFQRITELLHNPFSSFLFRNFRFFRGSSAFFTPGDSGSFSLRRFRVTVLAVATDIFRGVDSATSRQRHEIKRNQHCAVASLATVRIRYYWKIWSWTAAKSVRSCHNF